MKSKVTNAMHREQARISLTNNWGKMAGITFLAGIINLVISSIVGSITNFPTESTGSNVTSFLLNTFVFFALTYGTYNCALKVLRSEKIETNMLMSMFNSTFYFPMLLINLIEYLIGVLFNLVILLPVLLTSGASLYFGLMFNSTSFTMIRNQIGISTSLAISLAILFLVVGFVMIFVSVFISGVFQFAVWAKIDNPQLPVGKAINYAFSLMKGRFTQYLLLQLSFIGWFIVGALVFGIGLFWVIPYHNVAIASFYDTAREENE